RVASGAQITFGAGDGLIAFDHTDPQYSFDAAIKSQNAGAGHIDHYAGTTYLTGDSSDFSGDTTVHGGTLAVDNQLGGTVDVQAGATLAGVGAVGSAGTTTTIETGGTLAP